MKYKEYIELGFKRHDLNDNVEFNNTGYYGFSLEKIVNKKLSICVSCGELDKPKLYIKKRGKIYYNIILITPEIVKDLLYKKQNTDYENFA